MDIEKIKGEEWYNNHLTMIGKGNNQCGKNTIEIQELKDLIERKSISYKTKLIVGSLTLGAGAALPKVYNVAAKLIAIYF